MILDHRRSSTSRVQDKKPLPAPQFFKDLDSSHWTNKYNSIKQFLNVTSFDGAKFYPRIVVEYIKFLYILKQDIPLLLGCGGSSRVYLVENDRGKFALKAFLKESRVFLSSVIKEAKLLIVANSVKVGPQFYGLFPLASDQHYLGWGILMEFIGNQNSGSRIELAGLASSDRRRLGRKERARVSGREWLDIVLEIAIQVRNVHQAGLLLGDLSPDNVLVTRNDGGYVPYIIDFGMASIVPEVRRSDAGAFENDVVFLTVMMQGIDFVLESDIFHAVLQSFSDQHVPDISDVIASLLQELTKYS